MANNGSDDNANLKRVRFAPYLLMAPGIFFLVRYFFVPLFALAKISLSKAESVFDPEYNFQWAWSNFTDAVSSDGGTLAKSFMYAGIATLLCLLIGYPMAYFMAFKAGRWKNLLLGLIVVPFFTSFLLRTLAWQTLLGAEGPVVKIIDTLHLEGLLDALGIMRNGLILNTPSAVIGGLTYNFLVFMILPLYVSLEKINPSLLDAASDLYSRPSEGFRRVVLPLSLPGVFAGTLLTFIPASGDFVNAQFLGGADSRMIGSRVQQLFLREANYPQAAAMSFIFMGIIVVAVAAYTKFFGTEDLA